MKKKHISLSTKMVLGNILPLVLVSTFIIVSFLIALNKAINTDIEKSQKLRLKILTVKYQQLFKNMKFRLII